MKQLKKYAILLLVVLSVVTSLGGCGKKVKADEFATTPVGMYGEEPIYLDEVYFLAKLSQVTYDYYFQIYGAYVLGTGATLKDWYGSVLTMFGSGNLTTWQVIQQNTFATIYQTRILCDQAEKLGISLSEEDKKKVEEAVNTFMEDTEPELLEAFRANKELVTRIYMENALANLVYDKISEGYDTEVDREDYKTAVATYFKVTKESTDGLAESTMAKKLLQELQAAAKAQAEKEEDKKDEKADASKDDKKDEGIDYDAIEEAAGVNDKNSDVKVTLTESSNVSATKEPTALEKKIFSMKQGEVAMLEEEKAIYVIYLDDEDNEEAVDQKVDAELQSRKDKKFAEEYKKLLETAPALEVYDDVYEANVKFEAIDYPEVTTTAASKDETKGETKADETKEASGSTAASK